jgi:putative hydrolase of the HAD superfamily
MPALTTIAFDADDTLWRHEEFYQFTQEQFGLLLADFGAHAVIESRLVETERRNMKTYGYGVKAFTLSMIETAIEVTDGRIDASVIKAILDRGRDLLAHPIEPLDGVRETLEALKGRYRLIVITKGFDAVEIVSEKDAVVYRRIFERHGDGPAQSMMIGNSLKSDILPALETGAWGVHVPSNRNWLLDHAEAPENAERFRVVETIGEVVGLLDHI